MRPIEKCMPYIRDALIINQNMPQGELVSIVRSSLKIGSKTIREAIRICIDKGVINVVKPPKGRRLCHEWVLGSELPSVEYKPDIDNKFDYPRQSIVKADLCKPVKFKYNPLDILLHMWVTPKQQAIA